METLKKAKGNTVESSSSEETSSNKSTESKEAKEEAAHEIEESKGRTKDASKTQTLLVEGFCGFDETDEAVPTRSTRVGSKNAATLLTKRSARPEKVEGKSDSPPDLVLFLKEGRGRAQSYSEPPRLDPESIATRRRTRVPEDPVALISKTKSASAEKAKKDQKGLIKKEKKTKVMDTPESLKRLARDGTRQVQTMNKESSDSGNEEKAIKKVNSKLTSEVDGDVKVKSAGTSTRLGEEQLVSISKRNSRGKRNLANEPEVEALDENRTTSPLKDSPEESMNYSNLGSILNKMSRNVADKRIPVVIMSKSEKVETVDSAKPKSKKKTPDRSMNTAVLKIASPPISSFPADKLTDDDASLSNLEGECMTPKQEDEICESPSSRGTINDLDIDEDAIVLKVNSDVRNEEDSIISNMRNRTENCTSSEGNSIFSEKVHFKQNIIISDNKELATSDNELSKPPGTKEAAISGPCQSSALKEVQGSVSSLIKLTSASSPVGSGTVSMPISSGLVITPIKQTPVLPKHFTPAFKASLFASHGTPTPVTSPISLSPLVSQVKPQPSTSLIKSSSIASHVRPTPVTPLIGSSSVVSQVKTNSVSTPIKPSLVVSQFKLSSSTSQVKPSSVMSQIKPSPVTSPIKPNPLALHIKPTSSTSQIRPNLIMSHAKPSPVTSHTKSSPVTSHHSHVKLNPNTSPIKSNPFMSQVKLSQSPSSIKSTLVVSQVKPSSVSSPINSSSTLSHIKPNLVASPIKSNLVVSQVIPSSVSSPLRSTSFIPPIKSSSITSPVKSGCVTSSSVHSQNVPSCVVSTPKIVSFGSVKGSMKVNNLASSKKGVKVSFSTKATSTAQTPKREITSKQEFFSSASAKVISNSGRNKSQGSHVSVQEASNSLSQKGPMLDYTDIETEEVVLGENEDSNGQMGKVGDMPAEGVDLLAHEELESSSEEDTVKIPDQPTVSKKESLSPEGRVALDHSYSSGGSSCSRKKSPTTYEKSLTPRPVYSNASPGKRSLDIMLHNDKINILRQMSQIFNDEKPSSKISIDENNAQPDTDNSVSSCSDGEDEEANTVIRKTKENIPTHSSFQTTKHTTADPDEKSVNMKTTNASTTVQENITTSEAMSSKPLAVEEVFNSSGACGSSTKRNSSLENEPSSQDKSFEGQETPPQKERKGKNAMQDTCTNMDSPFLGFPDPDPKVHHVPAYSLTLNEKISVQSKVGPVGEMIDIVDGFSFVSFSSENEMMSYEGTFSGKTMKTHRQWLKKKRRRRKRLIRLKGGMRRVYPKVLHEKVTPSVAGSATLESPKERGVTAECGAFASDDLDIFLDKNSHLNISYQIPKCKVTEDGVSRIDEEEVLEPALPPQTQTRPMSPHSPEAPHSSPGSPSSPHPKVLPSRTQPSTLVNSNTSAVERTESEPVHQYEEVNAIDILYPKEKYKYYYNKELCKETKADGSNVFVQRAGKLVPLTTILKSQKSPSSEHSTTNIKQSVELVYVYDGGKLLTLGGSLTKINPSNSDCVRARVVLPKGVPPIPKGETVAARAKKVQAVEINEDMAKFALSALQSSHLKSEQAVSMIDDSEELPPLPGPSSYRGNEEKMDVDTPSVASVDRIEATDAPAAVPSPASIKPTKTNILDIIAAKLAMSDDESDEKEEYEEMNEVNDVKESEKIIVMNSSQVTKHMVTEGKEEDEIIIKEEDKDANIDQRSIGTSEERKIQLLKQDVKEEKPKEETATGLEASVQKGDMKSETKVKDASQPMKDIQRSSVRGERVKEDGYELFIVKETRDVIGLENVQKRYPENDMNSMAEGHVGEAIILKEEKYEGDGLKFKNKNSINEIDLEKRNEEVEVNPLLLEKRRSVSKILEEKDKDEEDKPVIEEENKVKNSIIDLKKDQTRNHEPLEKESSQNTVEIGNSREPDALEEDINSTTNQSVNYIGKKVGETKVAEIENKEHPTLTEGKTSSETRTPVVDENIVNPPSKICDEEVLESICKSDNNQAEPIVSESISDSSRETPRITLLPSSQETGDKTYLEKAEFIESASQEAFRMDIKSKVFKKNMYRFPSLSREMKRLNMNFVNYEPPPLEAASEEKEEAVQEVKGDCNNDHCKLGCVCESLLCQRKSVEHCGRVECMFECSCRDESWKLPSGSGRTMNAVSIFNLDREQKEGLALREKDFKRTVIQTGSEVILVGAERKKREIRLPGRYRGTTVWAAPEFPDHDSTYFEPPELPLQPDYPGIPLSEASKYIKKFKLNIPWFDIKGISIWCMDHSCYDCMCLTDPTFDDSIHVESPKKIASPRAKPKSSSLKCGESFTSTLSALMDFDEVLTEKVSDVPSSNDLELKIPFVADANCSIMNIIVNNSETRRKYTWKLKEWYHHTEYFSARTAGYSKSKITEETKNMNLSGLAARDTTPEQIVESVVRSLRHQKASDELKLPSLPCGSNFEPFMDDSLINLQNAIGLNPCNIKKPPRAETSCPVVDLTRGGEEITPIPKQKIKLGKSPHDMVARPPKDLKGVVKRRISGLVKPPPKKACINGPEEGSQIIQEGTATQPSFIKSCSANPKEQVPYSEQKVPKKTLSLLEMMIDEENRGELELDLSNNIPGNALLVAEARFRKLINMNIIGVIGINKAGRCIIGTVDSDEALQVMHQIQNMIRNNTLDVGPNMREIFFPPPYSGIRPRFVMIRCDSHRKWEIVGVVQKKGPIRAPSKPSESKAKVLSTTKPQVPQVIDLEEEERQKQLAGLSNDIKQENNFDIIEPPSPDDKDSGAWEGSLPMIASVHSASDSNMAELIGSPEMTQEELEESHSAEESPVKKMKNSPSTQKALPDLVPISSTSLTKQPFIEDQEEGVLSETLANNSDSSSQPKVYFVPSALSVPSSTLTTSSDNIESPMKSVTLNVASNKAFGDSMEKLPQPSRSFGSGKKVSYILPKLPGSGKNDTSTPSTQIAPKNIVEGHDTDTGQAVGTPPSPSSKMLYIPATSNCVSKVLFVPSVSSGSSQRMMLLPTLTGTSPLDTSTTSTSTITPSTLSTATITTSKMKMVLVPSPQDANKMLLIPATPDGSDSAMGTSSLGNALAEGEKKKMLVLTPSVINNLVSRAPSSDTTQPYQKSCTGTLFVPLHNTGVPQTKHKLSEGGKDSQTHQECSDSQDNSDDVVVIGPDNNSLPVTGVVTCSESIAMQEKTPALFTSPAPIASSSRVAETNVVSSLTTISSTMPEKSSYPNVGSNSEVISQDKQHMSTAALNALLNITHEEMVTQTKPDEEGFAVESVKDTECGKAEKGPPVTKLLIRSQNSDTVKKEDTLDQEKKQMLIKKGGFHWSAVDLSINFKSVKLEWLLGTIRKNVLMNIYRMSKKTHSPVTLSVKNGTSTSMLYGFARYRSTSTLPILILGSVVSAVLSSSSVPDSMLFQINSIKYFIRENTGELSSYTYSNETHFVKLASKKRGNGGEMVGVGEQIEIFKMRDPIYQSDIEKIDTEAGKSGSSFTSPRGSCNCTEAGHMMCQGCSASESSSKWSKAESTSSQDSTKHSNSRVPSEDASWYASQGLQGTSLPYVHPKEECVFPGSSKLSSVKKLHSENERQHLNKPRTVSKMTKKKVSEKKARSECSTKVKSMDNEQLNLEKGESIIPKVEHESEEEGGDVDVLGDFEASPSILSDLRQQLEDETNEVQKLVSSLTSSGESVKRKGMKVQQSGPSLKKTRTGVSPSDVEQPSSHSRKASVIGKMKKTGLSDAVTSNTEEGQGKEPVDPLSRWPTHLAHLRPYNAGDTSFANEDENSDTFISSRDKMSAFSAKRSMLYAAINRSRQLEERNTEVHNKLERMRRRVMRQLFTHLQKIIIKIPRNPLMTHTITHAKKTVLCAGQRVCEILKTEEMRLTIEEENLRSERSALIKHLAAIIGDSTEEIKLKWRKWVRENMQNPTAKETFERCWQPFCLEKDILMNVLEDAFDIDYDGGSPLPEGSPLLGSSSSQSSGDNKVIAQKVKRPPGRRIFKKRGRKVGRPQKIQTGPGSQGVGLVDSAAIPTSILLMAGTSSRGRKIVRKEDMNFVT